MSLLAISWFALIALLLLTSENNQAKFRMANFLSLGLLGLIFRERLPSDIGRRERIGLSMLIVVLILVVVASLGGGYSEA